MHYSTKQEKDSGIFVGGGWGEVRNFWPGHTVLYSLVIATLISRCFSFYISLSVCPDFVYSVTCVSIQKFIESWGDSFKKFLFLRSK